MKLKILGTCSPYTTNRHNCPGFLVIENEVKVMLDCGSGCQKLLNLPEDLENLTVILSHLHRDHYNDIFNLQYASFSFHNLKRIKKPIEIYLPSTPELRYKDITSEEAAFAQYFSLKPEKKIKIGNLEISFCQTDHPLETYAMKITNGRKTIVYTADTSFSAKQKLVKFAQNADLLICESSLLKSYGFPTINSHLTAEQAGMIANEAGVTQLLLTHFWPEEPIENFVKEAKTIFYNVIAAQEGKIIDLKD